MNIVIMTNPNSTRLTAYCSNRPFLLVQGEDEVDVTNKLIQLEKSYNKLKHR